MKRGLNLVYLGVAIVLVWMLFRSSNVAPGSAGPADGAAVAQTAQAQAATPEWSRLALHIETYSGSPSEDLVIVARLYDKTARQAEAIQAASDGQWRGSLAAVPAPPVEAPAVWADRLQISQNRTEFVTIFERSMAADGRARLVLRPMLGGSIVRANLVLEGTTIESNEVTIEPVTAPGLDTLVARGRIAEVLERWSVLATVADEITRGYEQSPWGHYYRGVVERARRNPELARAAFQRAMDRVEFGQEPPIGLLQAIR